MLQQFTISTVIGQWYNVSQERQLYPHRLYQDLRLVLNNSLRSARFYHILFLICTHHNWCSPNGIDLNPDALSKAAGFIDIRKSWLQGKEGAIIAVAVYPAADNVNLVYFSLAYNAGRIS